MIVILGAGYAGAATAWALARRGHGSRVTLLELESSAGLHASGRNAGLIAPLLDDDPVMAALGARGAALLAGIPVFSRCGSLRLTADEAVIEGARERARLHETPLEVERTVDAAASHPLLEGAATPWALRFAGDGVVEPRELLDFYLESARARGVRVVTGVRVTGLAFSCARLSGVETTDGKIRGEWVVNAAGAWASELAARLGGGGLDTLGLAPTRRHLFVSGPRDGLDPLWPFLWDLSHQVYLRVAGRRLLLCPCDEEAHPAESPEVSPAVRDDMARRLAAAFPAAVPFGIEEGRACLRTFAPDRRYVIGPDPRLPGFFWVAGLGGSGAIAGPAIGDLAADLLLTGGLGGQDWTKEAARWFDPSRLRRD
jgi:D-arginine dehydrogenase